MKRTLIMSDLHHGHLTEMSMVSKQPYSIKNGNVYGFGLPLSARSVANILNDQRRRIGRLESALKVIRTWANFDLEHSDNELTPTALDGGDVQTICDRVLNTKGDTDE